ncbi:MAG TPA: FecR domain-containing protein [Steroidobacteraceae bacterium]|nr:FecR domain-containing protein [Steroidobacteraceae bacterium]
MSAVRTGSHQTVEQAASWTTLLESGEMSDSQRQAFHAWLEEPRNVRALGEFRSLLGLVQGLPEHKAHTLRALPLPQARFPGLFALFARPLRLAAVAAAAAAALAAGAWFGFRPVRELVTQTYSTETGESRTVILRDGTVAHLNTESRIRWVGSRRVALIQGEVLFEVAHDPQRPFHVTVDNSEIRDLATQFDVYRKSNGDVVVTVLSGQVAVKELTAGRSSPAWAERRLSSDQQIEYTASSLVADVHPVAAQKAVRWREGLLETEGQSLATIVEELNRYSSKRILIADPRLTAEGSDIGGTLPIHDVPAALARIEQFGTIVVTDIGDAYVLTFKGDGNSEHHTTERGSPSQPNGAGHP